jgi:hypothetical protein
LATATEIATVRLNTNEPDTTRFTDSQISDVIDAYDDLDAASAQIWRLKAGKYADLADVQEGGSRRSLGDLHEQAIAMAKTYEAASAAAGASGGRRPGRTRAIERP